MWLTSQTPWGCRDEPEPRCMCIFLSACVPSCQCQLRVPSIPVVVCVQAHWKWGWRTSSTGFLISHHPTPLQEFQDYLYCYYILVSLMIGCFDTILQIKWSQILTCLSLFLLTNCIKSKLMNFVNKFSLANVCFRGVFPGVEWDLSHHCATLKRRVRVINEELKEQKCKKCGPLSWV